MRQKLIAGAIGIALLSLAAVGAFASQDAVHTQSDPSATAEATHTPRPHATKTADDKNADDTETPEDAETPEATETPEASETPGAGDREIKGIPTTNPNFHPEDGDGVCEHGESVVKTTPAGTMVNVPCEAAQHGSGDHDHGKPDASKTPEAESGSSD